MAEKINRRDFMASTAAAGLMAAAAPLSASSGPTVIVQGSTRPVVISSANGHRFRNGGTKTCVETAFEQMMAGTDVLDALIAGVNIVELDPEDTSVGYGGLPNADGVVQLDSSAMHGPTKRAGAVACIEGVTDAVARGQGRSRSYRPSPDRRKGRADVRPQMGFEIHDDLNTPRSRAAWLEWKKRIDPAHFIKDPAERAAAERAVILGMIADGLVDENHVYGTINCDGVNPRGRDLRRHDDERPGLEDPRPRR